MKLLNQSAVGEYLAARFKTDGVPKAVLSAVYRRSEGNPLFMVNVTDYLVGRDAIARENGAAKLLETSDDESAPDTIRDLIERQVSALSSENQELLETGAVAGVTFSAAVVSGVLGKNRETTEHQYRELARTTHFLQYAGTRMRPNGHAAPRYSFVHALYHNVIYDRVDEARKRRLHQAIGERTEAAFAGNTDLVAAELALHFERARDFPRATKYLAVSAQLAAQRGILQVGLIRAVNILRLFL